jgi:hypothetical protein
MNLACVKCTSVLDKARVGDVEVDLCPSCGGLWLDHGEIERLGRGPVAAAGGAHRIGEPRPGVGDDLDVPGLSGRAEGGRARAGARRVLRPVPRHLPR